MTKKIVIVITIGLIIGAVIFAATSFNGTNQQTTQSATVPQQNATTLENSATDTIVPEGSQTAINANTNTGEYITYEEFTSNKDKYNDSTVVYFFNAKWCPTCQALTKNITANVTDIPDNFVIVSVDYDDYTDLKQQYGVTIQHTLVQVDSAGNTIKKWSGGNTLESILSQV